MKSSLNFVTFKVNWSPNCLRKTFLFLIPSLFLYKSPEYSWNIAARPLNPTNQSINLSLQHFSTNQQNLSFNKIFWKCLQKYVIIWQVISHQGNINFLLKNSIFMPSICEFLMQVQKYLFYFVLQILDKLTKSTINAHQDKSFI